MFFFFKMLYNNIFIYKQYKQKKMSKTLLTDENLYQQNNEKIHKICF